MLHSAGRCQPCPHSHVIKRAHSRGGALLGRIYGQPKISQPHATLRSEEHVLRLDVAAQTEGTRAGSVYSCCETAASCVQCKRQSTAPSSRVAASPFVMATDTSWQPSTAPLHPPVHDVVGMQEGEREQQGHHHIARHLRLRQHAACPHQAAVQVASCTAGRGVRIALKHTPAATST